MMLNGGQPFRSRQQVWALLIMVILLGALILQTNRSSDAPYLSTWQKNPWDTTASSATGLTGVARQTGQGLGGNVQPHGNPLGSATGVVMTQAYGVGTHAPAHIWGAIDLALDGNNDGSADPDGTLGKPVYATHQGSVKLTRDSWPAGNHVWLLNDQYKTGYAHLQNFAVEDGQVVQRGQIIGYIGSTGQSSGPHLDYQVWQFQNGSWVNVNPLQFGALDALR